MHTDRLPRVICAVALACLLQACASYPTYLDERANQLQTDIDAARSVLSAQAAAYRVGGKDFYIALSGRPLKETLDKFNSLSGGDRTMSMSSVGAGGRIFEVWTQCWPFNSRFGFFLAPAGFQRAMGAVLYVDKLEYRGWHAGRGLDYALKGTAGAAYAILYVGAEICIGSIPVLPIFIGLIGGTLDSAGESTLTPKPGEGIEYQLKISEAHPMWLLGVAYVYGFTIPVPFPMAPELFKGKIPNIVGNQGEVGVVQGGVVRKYNIDVNFDQASFLAGGLDASGTIVVTWK